jgi:hypothetical protein
MTPLAIASAQLHEVFMEMQKAGFNEEQALYLCGQMVRSEHGE